MYKADTIIAAATANGRAAIAIVRLSGSEAFAVARRLLRLQKRASPQPWRLHRSTAVDPVNGEPIDDVLAVWMPGPRTYTGEDLVEIHCHGSPIIVESLIAAGHRAGARSAEPGEFTRRAVLNGRMDLLQAEAVADLVDARVRGGARLAWEQLQGALSRRLRELRESILQVLADVEANVDFSDDDLPEENNAARYGLLQATEGKMSAMLEGFVAARRWREGYRVVFTGAPNVGKSSLVNALLGYGRMIVSEEPGTTRDVVEECVDIDGYAFVFTDTAGVRETSGLAERLAVARSREKLAAADIVVHVLDGSSYTFAYHGEPPAFQDYVGRVVVLNKADLPQRLDRASAFKSFDWQPYAVVQTSALTGDGCDVLAATLTALVRDAQAGLEQSTASITRVRHRTALERSRAALARALELLEQNSGAELVSLELRAALDELATIVEPTHNEDVLDRIFQDFCVGK